MRWMVLAVALVGGCGVVEDGLEDVQLGQARDATWAFYGMRGPGPRLVLVPTEPSCGDWGFRAPPDNDCYKGQHYPDDDVIYVAMPIPGDDRLQTLAHELWHAVQWHRGGKAGYDYAHRAPEWKPGGLVEQAWTMLGHKAGTRGP